MYKYDGKYNIFKSEYPLGATPYGVLKSMSREFALYIPSCGAIDYAKAEEILTDSMLRMVLVPWGVFFTDLSKNIDEYDDPHDLEVEYQDFLSELHEWLPKSCDSFGKMMSYISSSEQLNTIDELSGKVMNFISTVFNFVLPESVKEVLQNRAVQGIMKVAGGVTQITAGCGLCTTLAGAFAGVPMIILGANMAIEGIQDLWHVVKGDLDVQSKNLLKEATGHKVDNILDLAEFVSTMGSAKAASKMSSKAFAEAQSKLGKALNKARNKAREIETVVSEKARLLNRAARQFIRRECGTFRGPKRFAKPVDFGRLFKKHGVKTAPGPGLQPLSEAEL